MRMHEVLEQQKKEKKEKEKRDKERGKRRRVKPEDMRPDAPVKFKSKLADQEREIHEAYQILLAESIKRRQQRRKQGRIQAIKEQEDAKARAAKVFERKTNRQKTKSLSKVNLI